MKRTIKETNWNESKYYVKKVNPALFCIIDNIPEKHHDKLYLASYLFGDSIVKSGDLYIPSTSGDLIGVKQQRTLPSLAYSAIPLALPLNRTCEVFMMLEEKSIPLALIQAGEPFGAFEITNYLFNRNTHAVYHVSAGVNSLFLLPKLTNARKMMALQKKYKLSPDDDLRYFHQQKEVFTRILNYKNSPSDWSCEVLLFGEKWFSKKNDLTLYFIEQAWRQAQDAIYRTKLSSIWRAFTEIVVKKRLRPNLVLSDTVKHLLAIGLGRTPGFFPATTKDESAAPIQRIQHIITDDYGLNSYHPTIMIPAISEEKLYYSLNHPVLIDSYSQGITDSFTLMKNLEQVKFMLDLLSNFQSKMTSEFLKFSFDYFHLNSTDLDSSILSSEEIPKYDQRFSDKNKFCANSLFWRGTISINRTIS